MNYKTLKFIALVLLTVLLTGCKKEPEDLIKESSIQEDKIQIGVTFESYVIERWQRDRDVFVSTANELGADVKIAKRAGLLHDIGKAVDHEMEGPHVAIGVDLLRKYKESPLVIHAMEAHHEDVEPQTIEAVLIQAADAISAARPGARRETLESYIKRLEKLEEIANSFNGIDKSFAIQAGREIRIIVKPDKVNDEQAVLMAREIVKQVEKELEYPGQIKVNVIRETRAVEYAK